MELYHYGVKGMKWGIRRDRDKKSRKQSKRTSEDESQSGLHLTDKQKRAIKIGLAVAGVALATYGAYKLGAFDKKTISSGQSFVDNTVKPAVKKAKLGIPKNKEELSSLLSEVNPSRYGTNCRSCTLASILRFRGINAESVDLPRGSFSDVVKASFRNARVAEMYSPNRQRVNNYILKKFPEGSYGGIAANIVSPSGVTHGHAFNWRVKDGLVEFFDGQSGLTDVSKYLDHLGQDAPAEIARLDNLEIIEEGIKKYVKYR